MRAYHNYNWSKYYNITIIQYYNITISQYNNYAIYDQNSSTYLLQIHDTLIIMIILLTSDAIKGGQGGPLNRDRIGRWEAPWRLRHPDVIRLFG